MIQVPVEKTLMKKLSLFYVVGVSLVSLGVIVYTSVVDMPSMHVNKDGLPHLSPPVINPDTGESIELGVLVRNFTGD